MTFEEASSDGTVNIFRLLRVPVAKLTSVQSQLRSQSRLREQELDQVRRELEARRATFHQKEQEAEVLLLQLKHQLGDQHAKSAQNDSNTPVVQRLKEASIRVEKRAEDTEAVIRSAQQRIATSNEERKAMCARLITGMTKTEVTAVLGNPTIQKTDNFLIYEREKRITISFDEDTGETKFIYGCKLNELGDEKAKAWRQTVQRWEQETKASEASPAMKKQKTNAEESQARRKAERAKHKREKEDRAVKFIDCAIAQMGKSDTQREECPEPRPNDFSGTYTPIQARIRVQESGSRLVLCIPVSIDLSSQARDGGHLIM